MRFIVECQTFEERNGVLRFTASNTMEVRFLQNISQILNNFLYFV